MKRLHQHLCVLELEVILHFNYVIKILQCGRLAVEYTPCFYNDKTPFMAACVKCWEEKEKESKQHEPFCHQQHAEGTLQALG